MPILDFNDSSPAIGSGGPATSQTEAADTSSAPVDVVLPVLADIDDGYIVRVYDSTGNAAINNITIKSAPEDGDLTLGTIDENNGEQWWIKNSVWEQRGLWPEPVASSPLVYDLSVAEAATSLWFAPETDPFTDVIAGHNLTTMTTIVVKSALPPGLSGFYTLPQSGAPPFGSPATGTVCAVSRDVDRGFDLVIRGQDYGFPSGGVLQLGEASDSEAWGLLKYDSGFLSWFDPDGSTLVIQGPSLGDIQGKIVYIALSYDATSGETEMVWNIEGAGEISDTGAQANSGTGAGKKVYIGASSIPTAGMCYFHAALYDHVLDSTYRNSIYSALGWA